MKKNFKYLMVALLGMGLMFTSCKGTETTDNTEDTTTVEGEKVYDWDIMETSIDFIAYKFAENKTGVGGKLGTASYTNIHTANDPLKVIEGLGVIIETGGVTTGDSGRDAKIVEFFFKTINTSEIEAEFVEVKDGSATVAITFNDITNNAKGTYTLDEEGYFEFTAVIDVLDWNGQAGIDALNEECHDLHIDLANDETESKLWSDVTISFKTRIIEVE